MTPADEIQPLVSSTSNLPYPRVLVIDEPGDGLKSLIYRLEGVGVEVSLVHSMTEALEHLASQAFGLILFNAKYRKGDYKDALAVLQATRQGKDLPLVAVLEGSLKGNIIYEDDPAFPGGHRFRPVTLDALVRKILMHLEIARSRQEISRMWDNLKRMQIQWEEERNRFKEFIAFAEQDLWDPLRKIHAFSSRLETGSPGLSGSQKNYLDRLKKSAHRMENYVQDILDYFKILSQPASREPVNLNQVMQEVLETLRREIHRRRGQVEVDPLPVLSGNRSQLKALLRHVLSNALKFQKTGQAPQVRVRSQAQPDRWVLLIEDNGVGFDPGRAQEALLPFGRLHEGDQYPGSGLGLAACRDIMKAHGGELLLESRPGEGTRVQLSFPHSREAP